MSNGAGSGSPAGPRSPADGAAILPAMPSAPPPGPAPAAFDPAAAYGPAFRRAGPATPAGGGFSGAGVWRVPTASGDFALRLWPAAPPPRGRLAGLHALLAHVAGADPAVPVAAPVRTTGGETLIRLGGRLAQLEPWRPGEPLGVSPSSAELTAAAGAPARFHAAAASFVPTDAAAVYFASSPAGIPPSLTARRDRLGRWLAGTADRAERQLAAFPPGEFREAADLLLTRLRRDGPAASRELSRLAAAPVPLSPVLRDVHREHVLMTAGRVTGLIDASAALADSPAADLARLATSLAPDRLDELVAAYRTARPFTDEEADLARGLADAGALLSGLAWVARGTLEGVNVAADPAALARLRHFAGWVRP